jgi:hypothetical protein
LTPEVVQRAGQLREAGDTVAQIGQALGLSRRSTFRALAQARPPTPAGPLSEDDMVALLERQARRGHVRAIELLLRRPWEADRLPAPPPRSLIDELAARRAAHRDEARSP